MHRTWQQLLAAYVDGETTEIERHLVETWLRKNPELNAELRAQQQFSPANQSLWSGLAPPLPAEERWQTVLPQIEQAVFPGIEPKTGSRARRPGLRRFFWPGFFALVGVTTAAAVLFALLPLGRNHPPVQPRTEDENTESVYSVASSQDVDIISVRPNDWPHVVVGEQPVPDSMTFVSAADVKFHGLQPDGDGMMPHVQSGENSGMPMVFAPLSRAP